MNRPAILYALAWKEFRQVLPLIWMVMGLGVAISALLLLVLPMVASTQASSAFMFLALPMIYATGVGSLLVGSEKDNRSLHWLRSLPISSQTIAWTKALMAVFSLLGVWILSMLLLGLVRQLVLGQPWVSDMEWRGFEESPALPVLFPLTSFFLAFTGMALAWRFSTALNALLMLVPAGMVVWLMSEGMMALVLVADWGAVRSSETGWFLAASLGLCTLLAIGLGWRASQRCLRADPAPRASLRGFRAASLDDTATGRAWMVAAPRPIAQALVWQSVWQAPFLFFGSVAMLVIAVLGTSGFPRSGTELEWLSHWVPLLTLIAGVSLCWLGCSAFQGDNIGNRIRFLADRGVSPHRVWRTRHWIPVLVIVGAAFLRLALRSVLATEGDRTPEAIAWDFVQFLIGALAIYVVCQWFSQCIKSPVVCFVTAPLLAGGMVIYGTFATQGMQAPLWTVGISLALLVIATWVQMKPWMDRAMNGRYYATHGGFLSVALIVPLIPGLWSMATIPRMPHSVRKELIQETVEARAMAATSPKLLDAFSWNATFDEADSASTGNDAVKSNFEIRERLLNQLQEGHSRPLGSLGPEPNRTLRFLLGELVSSQMDFEQEPSEANRSRYRKLVEAVLSAIATLRSTQTLASHDYAETLEIALLRACRRPTSREELGDELHTRVIALLSDAPGRDASRRRALAATWNPKGPEKNSENSQYLGSYYLQSEETFSMVSAYKAKHRRDMVVARLWNLLKSPPGAANVAERDALQRELFMQFFPSDVVGSSVWVSPYDFGNVPGAHWRGAWEVEAQSLAKRPVDLLPTSKEGKVNP